MFALEPNADIPDIANAVNYLLANFSGSVSANNVSGQITGPQNAVVSYLYKYLAIKYSDSFDGTLNFSDDPTNRTYYGLHNSDTSAESTDPTKYVWIPFTFGTTKFIWYVVTGGRQLQFAIQETPPNDSYKLAGVPSIDLDLDINDIILRIQDVSIEAGIADSNAQEALSILSRIANALEMLVAAPRNELGVLSTQSSVDLSTQVSGILTVPFGGSGRNTGTTAYSLLATGTTATGTQQTLANGATTELLVGGGGGALPVWTTATGTGSPVRAASPTITGHPTIEGVTSTGATGTGKFVFDTSPTLVTPILGTPQSGNFSTGTFTWPTFNQDTTGSAAKLLNGANTYTFTGVDIPIGVNVGTYSSTLPTGTSASTNKWLEVIIDSTSWWVPIWLK